VIWDPAGDDPPELTFWDRLAIWWANWLSRYCLACDEQYRPWSRRHRSCHCGISRPDTWTPADRVAFRAILDAARRKHGGESRDLGPCR